MATARQNFHVYKDFPPKKKSSLVQIILEHIPHMHIQTCEQSISFAMKRSFIPAFSCEYDILLCVPPAKLNSRQTEDREVKPAF